MPRSKPMPVYTVEELAKIDQVIAHTETSARMLRELNFHRLAADFLLQADALRIRRDTMRKRMV